MHRTNGFISVQYKYYLDNVRERERERGRQPARRTVRQTYTYRPTRVVWTLPVGPPLPPFPSFSWSHFPPAEKDYKSLWRGYNQTHYILSERLLSDTSSRHFNVLQWGFLHTNYSDPLLWQLIFWSIFLKEYTGNHIPELCKWINRLLASNRSL